MYQKQGTSGNRISETIGLAQRCPWGFPLSWDSSKHPSWLFDLNSASISLSFSRNVLYVSVRMLWRPENAWCFHYLRRSTWFHLKNMYHVQVDLYIRIHRHGSPGESLPSVYAQSSQDWASPLVVESENGIGDVILVCFGLSSSLWSGGSGENGGLSCSDVDNVFQ